MQRYSITTCHKAKEFIESLDKLRRARVDRIYYLFEEYGVTLPGKYLRKIDKGVWELRPGDVRLFLGIKGTMGVIVHGFLRKHKRLPGKI